MKILKITMSKGNPLFVTQEQAEKILSSDGQIVLISENGKWSGKAINKSFIVSIDVADTEEPSLPKLSEAPPSLEERIKIKEFLTKIKSNLFKKYETKIFTPTDKKNN